jgi:nucleoside-diphosphate-sugar epimerase
VKALVTGSAGFVGRHMVGELQSRGWDVVGIDLVDANVESEARGLFLNGDVRSLFKAKSKRFFGFEAYEPTRFDLVVHCAYHVGGRAAIDGNPSLLALNLELDAQLFDWAVRTGQRAVMYFSSSAAYPVHYQEPSAAFYHSSGGPHGGPWVPLVEDMINLRNVRQPDARYGWAKLTGEQLAAAAAKQGLRVHVLRPFSGYGVGQDDVYPFPAVLSRVLGGDMSVWGRQGQFRDWVHIDDVVRGALAVYESDCRQPVNLCTGVGTEFGNLVIMMARAIGVELGPHEVTYLDDQPMGVACRVGNPTRMLGFYTPKITIEEGIRMALAEVQR